MICQMSNCTPNLRSRGQVHKVVSFWYSHGFTSAQVELLSNAKTLYYLCMGRWIGNRTSTIFANPGVRSSVSTMPVPWQASVCNIPNALQWGSRDIRAQTWAVLVLTLTIIWNRLTISVYDILLLRLEFLFSLLNKRSVDLFVPPQSSYNTAGSYQTLGQSLYHALSNCRIGFRLLNYNSIEHPFWTLLISKFTLTHLHTQMIQNELKETLTKRDAYITEFEGCVNTQCLDGTKRVNIQIINWPKSLHDSRVIRG